MAMVAAATSERRMMARIGFSVNCETRAWLTAWKKIGAVSAALAIVSARRARFFLRKP